MASPVRYPSGICDRAPEHPMFMCPVPDPTKHHVFSDDFNAFIIAASGVTGWIKTEVNTGSAPAVTDAAGGIIAYTLANADNDNQHHQWGTGSTVHEIFKIVPGKKAWLRVKFKVEDADQDLPHIGLQVTGGDPWGTEPTDQFVFRSLRAAPTAIQFACGKTASTEVTVSLGTTEDDTFMILTAYYDGKDTVHAWRESTDGTITHSGSVSVTSSTRGDLLPDTEMTVAHGMEAMDAGTDVFSIDYILAIVER